MKITRCFVRTFWWRKKQKGVSYFLLLTTTTTFPGYFLLPIPTLLLLLYFPFNPRIRGPMFCIHTVNVSICFSNLSTKCEIVKTNTRNIKRQQKVETVIFCVNFPTSNCCLSFILRIFCHNDCLISHIHYTECKARSILCNWSYKTIDQMAPSNADRKYHNFSTFDTNMRILS